jgi:ribosome biogenesis GTPase / thiamine phosphate phosphatase
VLGAVGGVYRLGLDDGRTVDAFLRGRIKREVRTGDRVVAGDRVYAVPGAEDDAWTIESVEPRSSELVRAGPGGRRPKVVAANLDRVFVVLSATHPPFQAETADRFLVLAESCGIPPLLVITKIDLEGAREALGEVPEAYRRIGYRVLAVSAVTGEGIEELRAEMQDRTLTFVGPSGVGKSTLVNTLDPRVGLRTAPVGGGLGRGRHTTVSAQMIELEGGIRVIDTPGFSEVEGWGVSTGDLAEAFPEFREPSDDCHFRGCSHTHEPSCGVAEALEDGLIDRRRYESYLRLREGKAE